MKKQFLRKLRQISAFILLTLFNLAHFKTNAAIDAAGVNGTVLCVPTDLTSVNTLNCDMVHVPDKGAKLIAVAYDGVSSGSGAVCEVALQIIGSSFPMACTTIALPSGATNPDIVIADDLNSTLGYDFLVVVVYELSGNVLMDYITVSNVGVTTAALGTFSSAFSFNSSTPATNPRIDLSGDITTTTYGGTYCALHHFTVIWKEPNGASPDWLYTSVGDLPPSFSISTPVNIFPGYAGNADVASRGYTTISAGSVPPVRTSYVTFSDNNSGNLMLSEFDADNTNVILTTPTLNTVSTSATFSNPRIEAQTVADVVSGYATYEIATEAFTGTYTEIHTFNDAASSYVCSLYAGTNNLYRPAVTGVGRDCSLGATYNQGNDQFSVCYFTDYTNGSGSNGDMFTESIDINGGIKSPTNFPDEYEVSNTSFPNSFVTSFNTPAIAVATSSNTGDDLLTVWYNGWNSGLSSGQLRYKLTGNNYAYKTTNINKTLASEHKSYQIYPNPASTHLDIKGAINATYTVTDIVGKTIATGSLDATRNRINTINYAAGTYILSITENGYTQKTKFTVQ